MKSELSKVFWQRSNAQALGSKLAKAPEMRALNEAETAEIISLMGQLENKSVLELGAGIGRFTTLLASKAKVVDVIDICPEAIDENRNRNRDYKNINYLVADINEHPMPYKKYDLIFSNWLLMYLGEKEIKDLLSKTSQALRPDGVILFRESCERNYKGIKMWRHILSTEFLKDIWPWTRHPIYNIWQLKFRSVREFMSLAFAGSNLVAYRSSCEYQRWFSAYFKILSSGYIKCYYDKYGNNQQRYWLMTKPDIDTNKR